MSQVTDPVMLDSTGQIIVSKLQDVIDAINGGTIDPLTVTQNGTYTPSGTTLGYGPVTVNVGGGRTLPPAYQEVEYLSIGASMAYISIPAPLFLTAGMVLEFSAQADNWSVRNSLGIVGIKANLSDASTWRVNLCVNARRQTLYSSAGKISLRDDTTIYSQNESIARFGEEVTNEKLSWAVVFDVITTSNRTLFYGAYSSTEYVTSGKLYKLTITRADGYQGMCLVPCYRKADNICGFYELSTGVFITATTGSFTAGPDVN